MTSDAPAAGDAALKVGLYGNIEPVEGERAQSFNVDRLDRKSGNRGGAAVGGAYGRAYRERADEADRRIPGREPRACSRGDRTSGRNRYRGVHPAWDGRDGLPQRRDYGRVGEVRQDPAGAGWVMAVHHAAHPGFESSDFETTAAAIRVVRTYGPKALRGDYEHAAARGTAWLEKARPKTVEDRSFQILGLVWGHGNRGIIRNAGKHWCIAEARRRLGAAFRMRGPKRTRTGEALVALRESGVVARRTRCLRRAFST